MVQLSSFNVTTVGVGQLVLGSTLYTSVTTLNFVGNLMMKVRQALALELQPECGVAEQCSS